MPHETATTILRWRDATGLGLEHAVFEDRGDHEGVSFDSVVIAPPEDGYAFAYSVRCDRSWRVREASILLVGAPEPLEFGLIGHAAGEQVPTQLFDGIPVVPGGALGTRAVLRNHHAMRAMAVGLEFNQGGPLARPRPCHRLLRRLRYGEQVVAVRHQTRDAVRCPAISDVFNGAVARHMRRGRVVVVLADEDQRPLLNRRHVQGLV